VKQLASARIGVLIAVILWGLSFVATKTVLRETSPAVLIFARFGLGTALLFLLLGMRGTNPLPPRQEWPALALMGFIGIFIHQMLQAIGLTTATAVHTGWLIGLIPLWSALLSAAFLKERLGALKLAGLAGGFAGAVLVISQGNFGRELLKLPSTRGDFLILLSTFNWAVYTVLGHGTIRRIGPLRSTAGMMLFGTLMLAPLFVWNCGWSEIGRLSAIGWTSLLFLGIGCSGIGYLCWYGALEHIEVSRVSAFLYIEPFVTLAAAVVLLHESLHVITVIGGLVVLLSVWVLQRAPK
jgi:drug/metabolite transporter (DMT)-like permease